MSVSPLFGGYATLFVTLADHGNGWLEASVVCAPSFDDRYLDPQGGYLVGELEREVLNGLF